MNDESTRRGWLKTIAAGAAGIGVGYTAKDVIDTLGKTTISGRTYTVLSDSEYHQFLVQAQAEMLKRSISNRHQTETLFRLNELIIPKSVIVQPISSSDDLTGQITGFLNRLPLSDEQKAEAATIVINARKTLAYKYLKNNLLEKATLAFKSTDDGKTYAEALAATPKSALKQLLENLHPLYDMGSSPELRLKDIQSLLAAIPEDADMNSLIATTIPRNTNTPLSEDTSPANISTLLQRLLTKHPHHEEIVTQLNTITHQHSQLSPKQLFNISPEAKAEMMLYLWDNAVEPNRHQTHKEQLLKQSETFITR
jgi:hypothetical protein